MNSLDNPPPPVRSHRWFWVLLILAALVAIPCLGITSALQVSRDTHALRDSLLESTATAWDRQIEVSVGGITVGLVRTIMAFIDVPAEAHTGLRALRGAEVGIYQRHSQVTPFKHAAILASTDAAMTRRGWDRLVSVVNPTELVTVYVPRVIRSPRDFKACVAVLSERELVIASVRSNLEPLLELALSHAKDLPEDFRPRLHAAAFH